MLATTNNGKVTATERPNVFQIFLQDEDGQNILSIDDGSLRQSLTIEIVNTSGQKIEFQSVGDRLSLNNHHFCISFRPGTLLPSQDEDKTITLKEMEEGWQMEQQDDTFYVSSTSSEPRVIGSGERITLTLENIGAAPAGGSRGTRVEIKYRNLQYQGPNETISGHRLQYLNIVNQRGKKQIPLYAGFLGSNTILNNGDENELTLTIQTLSNLNAPLKIEYFSAKDIDSEASSEVGSRWEDDIVKFISEKVPNYIDNEHIKQLPKSLFQMLEAGGEISFSELKASIDKLSAGDKQTTAKILIGIVVGLKIISQDDLRFVVAKFSELGFELAEDILKPLKVIKPGSSQNGSLSLQGLDGENTLDQAARFTVSFDVATEESTSKHWALVEKTDADDIQIAMENHQNNWVFGGKEEQGITPRWSFVCQKGWSLDKENREEILRLRISSLKTQLLSGYANLYVHYENIPGYWDGYITVPIHKGPLVYREKISGDAEIGCVGIGTTSPTAGLDIHTNQENSPQISLNSGFSISTVFNSNDVVFRNMNQLRFTDGNAWHWDDWAGLTYKTAEKKLIIGGSNSAYFDKNSGADIDVVFDGVRQTEITKDLKVRGNTAIGGHLRAASFSGNINASSIASGVLNAERIPKSLSLRGFELKSSENRLTMGLYSDAFILFLDKGSGVKNAQMAWRGGQWSFSSDISLKTEIENENNILSRLMKLNVRNYRWKDNSEDKEKNIGFIAQEVEPLFPTLVDAWKDENGHEEKLSLQYSQFGVLAVGRLKELKQEKDSEIAEMRKYFDEKIKEMKIEKRS